MPQIDTADILVRRQRGWRSAAENRPIVHDICPVSNAQRFTDVVIGDQHADAALLQVEDDLLNIGDRDRVDTRERLVEQDEARGDDQRTRDLRPPPLAARQRVRRVLSPAASG